MKSLKEEFLEILLNYQGILHKVSLVYFKNKSDREDNIQEIIYQLWKSFPTIKNHNSIGSWIYAVSINISLSSGICQMLSSEDLTPIASSSVNKGSNTPPLASKAAA